MNKVEEARAAVRAANAALTKALKEDTKGPSNPSYWRARAVNSTGAWKRQFLSYARCEEGGGHYMEPMTNAHGGGFAGMRCSKCLFSEYS